MKQFIHRLGGFIFISALLYSILLLVFNYFLEKEIDSAHTLRPDARVLLVGDSHLECSVNDQEYPVFENRARSAESYYFNYYKLKSFLEFEFNETVPLDVVCLTFNPFSLSKGFDSVFVNNRRDYFISQYATILRNYSNRPQLSNIPICGSEYIRVLCSSYTIDCVNLKDILINRRPDVQRLNNYKGSFLPEKKVIRFDDSKLNNVNNHLFDSAKFEELFKSSNVQLNLLKRIAKLTSDKGLKLVLINAPTHKDYNKRIYPELLEYNRSVADDLKQEYGTLYLDFHDMELPDSCFRDYDHLNTAGANVFTPILRDTLISLGLL